MKVEFLESFVNSTGLYVRSEYPHNGFFFNKKEDKIMYVDNDYVIYVIDYTKFLENNKIISEEPKEEAIKFELPIGVPLHTPQVSEEFALKMVALLKGQQFKDLVYGTKPEVQVCNSEAGQKA